MCEIASFNNFENSLTTVKVMTKTKVTPFCLGHGVLLLLNCDKYCSWLKHRNNSSVEF